MSFNRSVYQKFRKFSSASHKFRFRHGTVSLPMEINKTSCVKLRFASSTGLQSRSLIRMPLIRTDGNFHRWRKYLLSAKGFVTFIKSDFMECESSSFCSSLKPVFIRDTDLRSSMRVNEKIGCLENK